MTNCGNGKASVAWRSSSIGSISESERAKIFKSYQNLPGAFASKRAETFESVSECRECLRVARGNNPRCMLLRSNDEQRAGITDRRLLLLTRALTAFQWQRPDRLRRPAGEIAD